MQSNNCRSIRTALVSGLPYRGSAVCIWGMCSCVAIYHVLMRCKSNVLRVIDDCAAHYSDRLAWLVDVRRSTFVPLSRSSSIIQRLADQAARELADQARKCCTNKPPWNADSPLPAPCHGWESSMRGSRFRRLHIVSSSGAAPPGSSNKVPTEK